MKHEITALELEFLIKEFQELVDGKIDKIYHVVPKEIVLQLHIPNIGKKLLRITPNFIYLASQKADVPEKPSNFCVYLRKHLGNARIKKISQKDFERIAEVIFETKERKYIMIVELFDKGNIVLCDENYIILRPLENQVWKDRRIMPKEKYLGPRQKFDFSNLNEGVLKEALKQKKELVKMLATNLGLGGTYAEEICLIAGIDKNKKELSASEIKQVFEAVKKLKSKTKNPRIVYKNREVIDIVPIELSKYKLFEQKKFRKYNEAFDEILTEKIIEKREKEAKSGQQKQTEKIETIIKAQEKRLAELEKEAEESRKNAESIYEKYSIINEILSEIKKARKKYSWDEIKKKLKGHKIVKEINEKTGEIIVEI